MRTLASLAVAGGLFAAEPFVPADFRVPTEHRVGTHKLVPLGPALAKQDYDAYMSSIEHLRTTFGGERWPHAGLTMVDAVKDVEGEQARFQARQSFTYAVLTPDGARELGCVYISPSRKQGYDAQVRMWVTREQLDRGLEPTLKRDVTAWLAKEWPFQKVAWPGRDIAKAEWDALPDKAQ